MGSKKTSTAAEQGVSSGRKRLPPEGKRFQKGVSGNPKGRNGSDSKAAFERCVLQLLAERGPDLAAVLVSRAMEDASFMGLLLARIWPAPKVVTLDANVGLTMASDLGALNAKLERAYHLRMVAA